MHKTNNEAAKIIAEHALSDIEVARYLNVSIDLVKTWFGVANSQQQMMPESDLNFLKYCLMTDNNRSQLF